MSAEAEVLAQPGMILRGDEVLPDYVRCDNLPYLTYLHLTYISHSAVLNTTHTLTYTRSIVIYPLLCYQPLCCPCPPPVPRYTIVAIQSSRAFRHSPSEGNHEVTPFMTRPTRRSNRLFILYSIHREYANIAHDAITFHELTNTRRKSNDDRQTTLR